jgi:hypothetical protein
MKFLFRHCISIFFGGLLSYGVVGILGAQDLDDSGVSNRGLFVLAGLFMCSFAAAAADVPVNRRLKWPVFIGMSCISKIIMIGFAIAAVARLVVRYDQGLSLIDKAAFMLAVVALTVVAAELTSVWVWRFLDKRLSSR